MSRFAILVRFVAILQPSRMSFPILPSALPRESVCIEQGGVDVVAEAPQSDWVHDQDARRDSRAKIRPKMP